MKKLSLTLFCLLVIAICNAQTGHLLQGIGAVNMSMGGASTAQPIDISGAIHWNPASISAFNETQIKLDLGLLFASSDLSSSMATDALGPGNPPLPLSGTTADEKGVVPIPALAMLWGSEDSPHTFAASIFGASGIGVIFPEETNIPGTPGFDPGQSTNPITYPQAAGGFGRIESFYSMIQASVTWAYALNDKFSVGLQPNIDMATLEIIPNPTTSPGAAGYPASGSSTAIGLGGQVGLFFDSGTGFKAGLSYKTTQSFGDFEFDNGDDPDSKFNMDFPSIISAGLGYSTETFDIALDYRLVDYENTDGFAETGWDLTTGTVKGFGWQNISILSVGVQYKGIEKLPIRVGYTNSTNPISGDVAMFNVLAPAVLTNAIQAGLSYKAGDKISIDASYHHGMSSGKTEGALLNPVAISDNNPYGAVPGTTVSYDLTTGLATVGVSYKFN